MNKNPKVSICIPTYNQRPEFLRNCIQSALNQKYDSFEVVVSDNHSIDYVRDVLAGFRDARLRVIKPPAHLNASGNFAFCASQSVGEYLCFLSSDDLMYPDCCSSLAGMLDANPNVAFAHCAVDLIDEKGKKIGLGRSNHQSFIRKGIHELQRYVWKNCDAFAGIHIRRTAYEAAGGFEDDLERALDWYLSIKLTTVGDVVYHDKTLAAIRYWTSSERQERIAPNIRDTRRLYERLETDGIAKQIYDYKRTACKAKKKHAIAFSKSYQLYTVSPEEREQAKKEILLMNNSLTVRAILFMGWPGAILFSTCTKLRDWIGYRVGRIVIPIDHKIYNVHRKRV